MKFISTNFVATPGALAAIAEAGERSQDFLDRHMNGDWGDVGHADAQANDEALVSGERVLSSYRTAKGVKVWVITEAIGDDGKRLVTTILLMEEY